MLTYPGAGGRFISTLAPDSSKKRGKVLRREEADAASGEVVSWYAQFN